MDPGIASDTVGVKDVSYFQTRTFFTFPVSITVLRGNKGQANKGQISFSKKIYSGRIRDKYWEKNFNQIKYCRFLIFTFYLSVRKKSVIRLCLTFFSFTAGIVQISETSSSLLSSSFWKSSIISFSISICKINSSSTSAFSNSWSKSKSVVSLVFSQALRIVSFSVVQIVRTNSWILSHFFVQLFSGRRFNHFLYGF